MDNMAIQLSNLIACAFFCRGIFGRTCSSFSSLESSEGGEFKVPVPWLADARVCLCQLADNQSESCLVAAILKYRYNKWRCKLQLVELIPVYTDYIH